MPRRLLFALIFLVTLMPRMPAESRPEGAAGFPRVVSGDTLLFGQRQVRLNGIKAPKPGTICRAGDISYRCGDAARQSLARVIGNYQVSCDGVPSPRLYPVPVVCKLGRHNLNRFMLARGWAVVDQTSCGDRCFRYERIAATAQQAKRGVWQGTLPASLRPAEPDDTSERGGRVFGGWWY